MHDWIVGGYFGRLLTGWEDGSGADEYKCDDEASVTIV